ncbi:LPXTG-motif cell wall-anchored protein [Arthrobacter stackebrandtii]|uniref:LPXTG-motif cell wall-anchored protein n=1 Tax=Arthrobacter stackebrandtii TaxID=272161 RepID=A0ABS4YRY2_9MICC|nr:LPXTG cell wall anchor domain-containing protein [Arthrobacter stackebrandtii]MBP2411514.1 LPXTG-motif cell wall-anchored protein [Arthrobacter stackebrandtii]
MIPRMMPRQRVRTTAVAVALVAGAVPLVVVPGAEAAAPANISYSTDGVHYGGEVPNLFSGSQKLAPGEGIERTLWVRNGYPMTVTVGVQATTPVEAGGTELVGNTQPDVTSLQPGAEAAISVAVLLPEEAGNTSQDGGWPVRLQVKVGEATPAGPGQLPVTGAQNWLWTVGLAVLLGGAGAYMRTSKRRESP